MEVLDLFYEISKLNRCSKTYEPFINYIKDFAKNYGFETFIDNSNNILCKKSSSTKIALQAHYDIVCLKSNQIPKIIIKDNIIKAIDSTLGADNGLGCAYMLSLMSEGVDLEYLFTSDEEIGLIGANNIDLKLNSKILINLDSEKEDEICIGSAGGVDIIATINLTKLANYSDYYLYKIEVLDLPGGHSGVDIDKNIPNAIKELISFIVKNNAKVLEINGGERINSIPSNASAIIAVPKEISSNELVKTTFLDKANHINFFDDNIFKFLDSFKNGVLLKDEFGVVDSINLALIETKINSLKISFSARSMDNNNLDKISNSLKLDLEKKGFEVELKNKYSAWKPNYSNFVKKVEDIYKKYYDSVKVYAIHAGLECGILKEKLNLDEVISIGPNIFYPHSVNEYTQIDSIQKNFKILKKIIQSFEPDIYK